MPFRVTEAEFERLVESAIRELPAEFARALDEVPIVLQDRPTAEMLRSLGLEEDDLLLGLYVGVSLPERSVEHSGQLPDRILLFKEDIELASDSRKQFIDEVRITVLHELGHHFGMDEDQLDALGYR